MCREGSVLRDPVLKLNTKPFQSSLPVPNRHFLFWLMSLNAKENNLINASSLGNDPRFAACRARAGVRLERTSPLWHPCHGEAINTTVHVLHKTCTVPLCR